MKLKILSLFFLTLLFACKKENNQTETLENKKIENVIIGFDKPMFLINSDAYVALRYSNDNTGKDNVKIILDGKEGTQVNYSFRELEGENYLFKYNTRDPKLASLQIMVNNKIISTTQVPIVSENSLATLWNSIKRENLSFSHILFLGVNNQYTLSGKFIMNSTTRTSNYFSLGTFANFSLDQYIFNPFILGLEGNYHVSFNSDNSIKDIIVNHFTEIKSDYPISKVYQDLERHFNSPVSTSTSPLGIKITTYVSNGFQIKTYEESSGFLTKMYSVITKI